jgi:hypothetical protein
LDPSLKIVRVLMIDLVVMIAHAMIVHVKIDLAAMIVLVKLVLKKRDLETTDLVAMIVLVKNVRFVPRDILLPWKPVQMVILGATMPPVIDI